MINLPYWLPALIIGSVIQWLIVRSATRSALRAHERERETFRVDQGQQQV
ncbi:hypothetical protein SERN_2196 [Serinibacter arcticus]|uniref:Uncharacterized protein n=2 Tax=Serinibacter arcticus TaxID=1655435 RepID=A0A4Z1E2C2_9MICO|nr:hypothetical protein SERN_2196 [Serinibacter arcticus]